LSIKSNISFILLHGHSWLVLSLAGWLVS